MPWNSFKFIQEPASNGQENVLINNSSDVNSINNVGDGILIN